MFQDCDENKLIYTDIFHEYTAAIESFIEQHLIQVRRRDFFKKRGRS